MNGKTLTLIEWCLKEGWSFSYNAKALPEAEAIMHAEKNPALGLYYRIHAGRWAVAEWSLAVALIFTGDTLAQALRRMFDHWTESSLTPQRNKKAQNCKAKLSLLLRKKE